MVKTICERCKKVILDNENRVNYSETNPKLKKTFIDLHFHTECWIDHYNESLDKKVTAYSKKLMSVTAPAVKKIFGGIKRDDDGGIVAI